MTIGLQYPVQTLEGHTLLHAGTVLTDEVMTALAEAGKSHAFESLSVLRFGAVRTDLAEFLAQPLYQPMFIPERAGSIMAFLEGVRLPRPLLEGLQYFRVHDFYTYRHILMVFALTALLAEDLIEDPHDRLHEALASPTHDFGKICVPMNVLKKASPLAPAERQVLKHHAAAGYALVSYYLGDHRCLSAVVARDHHERRDGSGYPQSLAVDDRMVEIVIVADVFDALLSPRPYRPEPYDRRSALEAVTLMGEKGKLRWEVVQSLVSLNRRGRPRPAECRISAERRGGCPPGNNFNLDAAEETRPVASMKDPEAVD